MQNESLFLLMLGWCKSSQCYFMHNKKFYSALYLETQKKNEQMGVGI